jgi:hypothetical protein
VWTKNSEEILEKAQILVHIRSNLLAPGATNNLLKQPYNGR